MISCQIIKDGKGNIINVEAPNGEDSMLYSDLKQVTGNENDAVTLWSYSYTEDFENTENESPRDQNGEHIYSTVLRHIDNINVEKSDFTEKDVMEFVESFRGTPVSDLNHAFSTLKRGFYTNGVFNVDKDYLVKSMLYTTSEVDNIVQNPKLQESIISGISKIKSFLLSGESTAKIDALIASNNNYIINTEEVSEYGKVLKLDEDSFDKKYGKDFIGVETKDQLIENILNTGDQILIQKATEGYLFLDELFRKYSRLQNVQNLKVKEGELVEVYDNDTEDLFLSTLKTRISNVGIEENYNFLLELNDTIWYNNDKEIKVLLEEIADNASKIGINLYGISDTYNRKSQLEILSFLEDTVGFTSLLENKIATTEDIKEYADIYDGFFGVEKTIKETTITKSELSLFAVDTLLSENEMYEKYNMIKVEDGIYQKVDKAEKPIEELFNLDLENRQNEGLPLLNDLAYYPIAYNTNNEFSEDRFKKAEEVDLQKSVESYINKLASEYELNADIIALKIAYKHTITIKQSENIIEDEITNYDNFTGDVNYLKKEFMHDFQMEKAKQQNKNSYLYNNILQYLEVKGGKLVLNTNNEFILNKINLLMPEKGLYKNIRNYATLSKDNLLHNTFSSKGEINDMIYKTLDGLERYYINNPLSLSNYKGEFKTVDSQHIEIDSKEDAFVRIKENIYKKVGESIDGITTYSKIFGQKETEYNNLNGDINISESKSSRKPIIKTGGVAVSQTNLYSKSEFEDLENEMDRC